MLTNIMLDLETLGTKDSSVILSIGAVAFDETGLGTQFYEELNIDDQLQHGRTVSGETIRWWFAQSEEARKVFSRKGKRLATALAKFTEICPREANISVWGNPSAFDNAILRHSYESLQIAAPWGYNQDRCFRTLKMMFPYVGPEAEPKVEHNALDDAIAQALHAQLLLAELKKCGK